MPYQTQWLNEGIVWTFSGMVSSAEALASNMEIYGDERFDSLRYQIADFSDADGVDFTEADLRKIAYLDMAASLSNPRMKVVIVAPNPEVKKYLIAYEKHAIKSNWETNICDSIEEARQWIGLLDS